MKIAITAAGTTLDAQVDPRFGRCPCFLIVETDDLSFEAVENPNLSLGGGAGIQSAQLMAEKGVKHVLTGNCGPNAHQTLAAAGIGIVVGCSGIVRAAVEKYKAGQLAPTTAPNVASHHGMGGGAGMGGGPGMGMGGGRGMGRGRGMGKGMGAGVLNPPPPADASTELVLLKQQAEAVNQQMQQIQQRIRDLEKGEQKPLIGHVDVQLCTGCGVCVDVCPVAAIAVREGKAQIDAKECVGCGACKIECPVEAIRVE